MFPTYLKGVVTVWAMGSFPSYPQFRCLLSNCLSSPSYLIIRGSSLIAILKSIWNHDCYAVQETESLQMTTTTTKGKGKLPTLLLKTLIGWVCPTRSSSPGVFAYWTSLLKQKDNADPVILVKSVARCLRLAGKVILFGVMLRVMLQIPSTSCLDLTLFLWLGN